MMGFLALLVVIFFVFKNWFFGGLITAGDWSFFYPEQIVGYFNLPFSWETFRNAGLGGNSLLFQGVYFYNVPLGFLGKFFSYSTIERILWFFPIVLSGLLFPAILAGQLKLFPRKFFFLSSFIFFLNSYFLMIMGGGQLTVVLAYLLIPLTLAVFVSFWEKASAKKAIIFGLILALLVAWDFRIAYLGMGLLIFYSLFFYGQFLQNYKKIIIFLVMAGLIILGIHGFWLLPFLFNFENPAGSMSLAHTSSDAVNFFSFAKLENTLSLLHPNWPENIFGKSYFMKWEFLFIPILAFSSLLFVNKSKVTKQKSKVQVKIQNCEEKQTTFRSDSESVIIFFVILGLAGAFLAKGSNWPFGEIYLGLFNYLPGMVMFRDSTKFYTLVALSYSVLIPYSTWKIYEWLKFKKYIPSLFLLLVACCLLLLIKPAWSGELNGTFKPKIIPREYVDLKNFINDQPGFFRTFWIPQKQRFAFYSDNHPAIDGLYFFNLENASSVVDKLKTKEGERELFLSGVKYVILPYDSEEELFIKDRQYDSVTRVQLEKSLDKIISFRKVKTFEKSAVYETQNFTDRFWLENLTQEDGSIEWRMINPTQYLVTIKNFNKPVVLGFSENYDPQWKVKIDGKEIKSQKIYDRFNSFKIDENKNKNIIVEYSSQKYLSFGMAITVLTLLISAVTLIILSGQRNEKKD
ncbi:MAG: hypothetical protein M1575_00215 [Patescibacteria group bacterium]|nr:hypothetical protein [Patescibacteria group bacterium]MCL5095150.1 hypothetical protein [Patescibacteria group bacterium]